MRQGRRVAIDVGTVRIGVACSDEFGILASPVTTIARSANTDDSIKKLIAAIQPIEPIEIYVGLPVSLKGSKTSSTADAIHVARELAKQTEIPIRLIDERLTTVSSELALRSSGKSTKAGRQIVDQIAATIILEQALQIEKNSKSVPGLTLEEIDG